MKPKHKNIHVEIVELYPLYGKPGIKLVFSAHVYIQTPDLDLDIRGYTVHIHNKNSDFIDSVFPPMQDQFDYEEKQKVKFPILNTNLKDWEEEIKKELILEGRKRYKPETFKGIPSCYQAYIKILFPRNEKKDSHKNTKRNFNDRRTLSYIPNKKK